MRTVWIVLTCVLLGACGQANVASPSPSARPASPAHVAIVAPTNGEVVHGTTVHVVVSVTGATITNVTSTHVSPTEGHVHLYLNGKLIYMAYTLAQDVSVQPGNDYRMQAEFVAGDHAPFSPRDFSQTVDFSVQP